jgi:hypothetical protein
MVNLPWHPENRDLGGEYPLCQLTGWQAVSQLNSVLSDSDSGDNIFKRDGLLVFEGNVGSGKVSCFEHAVREVVMNQSLKPIYVVSETNQPTPQTLETFHTYTHIHTHIHIFIYIHTHFLPPFIINIYKYSPTFQHIHIHIS